MKYLIPLLLLGKVACCQISADQFVLRGSVPGAGDNTRVTLTLLGGGESITGVINGEKFELRGNCPEATYCKLDFDNGGRCYEINFFIEKGNLTFTTPDIDSLPMPPIFVGFKVYKEKNYKVTGSTVQDNFYRFQAGTAFLRYSMQKLKEKFRYTGDIEIARKLQQQKDELLRIAWEVAEKEENLNLRLHIVDLLKKDKFMYDQAYLDKLAALFEGEENASTGVSQFREYLERAKTFLQGTPLMEIELKTPEGKSVSLHSQLNKEGYTLLDFWASWCGPCRASFPHLKEVHERSGGKLKIISLSSDREHTDWLKALEEEKLPWVQLYEEKKLASSLDISFIPSYFLVDAEGKVVFFGGVHGELDLKLEELGL